MSIAAGDAWRDEWRDRLSLTTDRLAQWSAENWRDWLADGLDIWFFDPPLPRPDREYAFSPLGVAIGRENMVDALAKYLHRVCALQGSAAGSLGLKRRIEDGGVACFRDSVIVHSPARASFLLEVFVRFHARRLPAMARLSIQRIAEVVGALLEPDGEDYLSTLCYIVYDNEVIAHDDDLSRYLEQMLAASENFRPALSYSLRLPQAAPEMALARFYVLTRKIIPISDPYVWQVVAEEFDRVFGHDVMGEVVDRILEDSRGSNPSAALAPATRLQEYYELSHSARGRRATLWSLPRQSEPTASRNACRSRGIPELAW